MSADSTLVDQTALAALIAMCPKHTSDDQGRVQFDPDCGDCGSRQEAAGIYLVSLIEDVKKELNL